MPKTKKGKSSKSHLANIYNAQKQIRALKRQHRKALRKELIGVYEDTLLLTNEEIEELYNHSFSNNRAGRKPKLQDGEIVRTSIIFAHDARIDVWSRSEVCRIDPEPVWLVCPGFADELVGGEAAQGFEAAGVVIGIQEELEVRPELVVALVVVA